jgi:hypothetical protein
MIKENLNSVTDLSEISDSTLKEIFSNFIKKMENTLSIILPETGFKNLEEYVKNEDPRQTTQSKTKLLTPYYEHKIIESFKEKSIHVERSGIKGSDIKIFSKPYELKMSLGKDGKGWTGNNYSQVKVDNYLLIKLEFDNNNKVNKSFFGILNLHNSTSSSWTFNNSKKNNAFSNLKIKKEDLNNFRVIKGKLKINTKYLKEISEF